MCRKRAHEETITALGKLHTACFESRNAAASCSMQHRLCTIHVERRFCDPPSNVQGLACAIQGGWSVGFGVCIWEWGFKYDDTKAKLSDLGEIVMMCVDVFGQNQIVGVVRCISTT